jgi:folate-binding protein YgfZ
VAAPAEGRFLVQCPAASLDGLLAHIKSLNLRNKVIIDNASERYAQFALIDDAAPRVERALNAAKSAAEGVLHFPDPRTDVLGHRILVPIAGADAVSAALAASGLQLAADEAHYENLRIVEGVPSAPWELVWGESLPLENCLEALHGVHLNKGCYLGQELTMRTATQGVLRKRALPAFLRPLADTNEPRRWPLALNDVIREAKLHPTPEPLSLQARAAVTVQTQRGGGESAPGAAPAQTATLCSVSRSLNACILFARLEHVRDASTRFLVSDAGGRAWEAVPYRPRWWTDD